MIKAKINDGKVLLFGLSRKNCENLLDGKPILIKKEEFSPYEGPDIVICGGETEAQILMELTEAEFKL